VSLSPPRPSPLAPGFKLDRYELLCPIAEGGMASVWIARHSGKHGFEKFVAIKTVLPKFASDIRFQTMFQDEARIASRIEHTNVAQILDVGEQHDITYLVMEYVDGESLSTVHRALTKKGMKIPPGIVLRVLADVCGGLHTAHELREEDGQLLGVVHRDVSPQNVLVSSKGVAKLIDFGIAKARDRLAGDTNAGQVKGKIRYMAPEQAVGGKVDRRADIWAIGAILYHLLSGKPPYDGDNDVQALMVLTSGRPPVPLPSTVDPAVARVVKKALTASMESRFATAADLQQALEDAIVEAKLVTNTAAVAAFLAEHVADRAKKRKEAIAVGLKAASERDRYEEIMRSNVKVTAGISGTSSTLMGTGGEGTGSGLAPKSAHGMTGPGVGTGSGGAHVGSAPGLRSAPGAGHVSAPGSGPGSAPGAGSGSGVNHSVVTGGTLGSAAIDLGARRPSRGRTVAVAGVAVGVLFAAGGLVMMLSRPSPAERSETKTTVQAPAVAPLGPTQAVATAATAPVNPPGWTAAPVAAAATVPAVAAPAVPLNVPTVDANALRPVGTPVVQQSAPPATTSVPLPVHAAPAFVPAAQALKPAPKPVPTTKKRVDDGF
jgi:serine/threonine-protein kinase